MLSGFYNVKTKEGSATVWSRSGCHGLVVKEMLGVEVWAVVIGSWRDSGEGYRLAIGWLLPASRTELSLLCCRIRISPGLLFK